MANVTKGRWPPGTAIVQEEYWRQQLVTVRPVTVAEDSDALLALYSHAGSTCLSGAMRGRQQIPLAERARVYLSDAQPVLEERPVRGNVLTLTPPGAHHSVWIFWDSDWNLTNWYVNLQPPVERTNYGIALTDYLLDLALTPDLQWRWKDEDEFEAMCAAGVFSEKERRAIRAEGLRMVERIERQEWPFNSQWPRWRPDPSWALPTIPEEWRPHGPPAAPG